MPMRNNLQKFVIENIEKTIQATYLLDELAQSANPPALPMTYYL